MADNRKPDTKLSTRQDAQGYSHRAIVVWLPILYCLISSLFFLRTYDSAQVKISMMQMGGLGLLTLWLARLVEAGRSAFNRDDLVCLSPFLAYLAWGVFSYWKAPYHMASTDFFIRHFFYMSVALIVVYEFDEPAVQRLIKWLIWTAWIAIGYGTLQFVDTTWFPRGPGNGIDPFVWRGAFGDRVFSTYGNPNFYGDFLVIVFPILLTQYFKTRKFSLIPLMAMLLLNLIKTGTKGAWLGFAMVCALFGVLAFVFFPEQTKAYRTKILAAVAIGVLGFVGYTAKDLQTRVVSINFRLFTWEATWEMIRTQPWTGSGVGSFPPLYPAFRRPPIFHIEGKHNTETDHAEDEYLEQLFDNGILGFGIFLWLIVSTLVVGFRSLGQLTTTLSLKDGRPPPRAYDLMGLLVSFAGMLGHNFFDVSLRFVSSGVFLGLLSGLIVNVSRGRALYEMHGRGDDAPGAAPPPFPEDGPSAWRTICELLIWPARLAAVGALIYFAFIKGWGNPMLKGAFAGGMFGEFAAIQGPLSRIPGGGELLQWWLAWGTFAGCMLFLGWSFVRLCLMSENPFVPALVLAMLQPLYLFWGYFKADVHHNVAIYFSKEKQWDLAISNYLTVSKLNRDFVMAKYFLGNVYNDRFDMRKLYNPNWGDRDNQPMDDYDRALYWYNEVRRLSPNYVQMHHQVGNLHMRRAQWAADNGRPQESEKFLDLAMKRFRLYRQIDPVFPPNYYRIAQIHLIRKQYDEAIRVYEELIEARACEVDPVLLAKPALRTSILSYQPYLKEGETWKHKHAHPLVAREAAETYTSLANAQFMAERLGQAEQSYRLALSFEPAHEGARRNLEITYRKAQQLGRLKKTTAPPPASSAPVAGVPVYTGYEIAPTRK